MVVDDAIGTVRTSSSRSACGSGCRLASVISRTRPRLPAFNLPSLTRATIAGNSRATGRRLTRPLGVVTSRAREAAAAERGGEIQRGWARCAQDFRRSTATCHFTPVPRTSR
jgi:hypothetical protein